MSCLTSVQAQSSGMSQIDRYCRSRDILHPQGYAAEGRPQGRFPPIGARKPPIRPGTSTTGASLAHDPGSPSSETAAAGDSSSSPSFWTLQRSLVHDHHCQHPDGDPHHERRHHYPLLAKAHLNADYSQLQSRWVGETEKRIVRLSRQASDDDDVVLFFDEADSSRKPSSTLAPQHMGVILCR